ncbi:endolytic transglycosylase MltG [Paraglaciecola sp. 2405UD69-4]|uniref:endolytic transglycosylase MltG n=1 Tax=Paraglaciecola sp. 2405UD69-4 TaxID=3391836 RepID=UPI0039C99481
MGKFVKSLLFLFILVGLLVAWVMAYFNQQVYDPLNISSDTVFRVDNGHSAKGILNRLKAKGILKENLGLKIRLKIEPELAQIKVGTYLLTPSMTGLDLLQLLVSGKEKQFSVSLVEGLRLRDWLLTLKSHPNLTSNANLQGSLRTLGESLPGGSLEGWLLPDTYHFVDQTDIFEVILRANESMVSYLQSAWENRAIDLPYDTPYQGLIMASIIEKETGVAEERPRIAGVFVNRLRLNMRLQTDPTVIYGMGDNFDGNIRRKDLRTPTPYNTYVIKGLPPTPIAMPSKLAIDAAFHPIATEELYFVSKGDGSHKFSATLQEHNTAVRKYQLKK